MVIVNKVVVGIVLRLLFCVYVIENVLMLGCVYGIVDELV